MQYLTDLSIDELTAMLKTHGQPAFRTKQLIAWLWQRRVNSIDAMSDQSAAFRAQLAQEYALGRLAPVAVLASKEGDAVKFGFTSRDNWTIESVLLIDGDRRSLCVSSQIGCGMGCVFCRTGKLGFIRNLSIGEILGQIAAVNTWLADTGDSRPVTNLIFMGMGEALLNYKNFRAALAIIQHEQGFFIGGRKITVSTSGVVPAIRRFAAEGLNVGIAISLNSYNDEKRSAVMPVNRRWPIAELVKTAKEFVAATKCDVTFEYVVIKGENDSDEAARAVIGYLRGFNCKVNLIPLNPVGDDNALQAPVMAAVDAFGLKLSNAGLTVTVRKSRGRDIDGACGQLTSEKMV